MERTYYVIDAFTSEAFAGNAAAVVLDAQGLDDRQMQAIAAEFNLSETTFVLEPSQPVDDTTGARVWFRWFTPCAEVAMCGHATIAGVHALVESGRLPLPEADGSVAVGIETKSGLLTAFVERMPGSATDCMIWLDLIDPVLTPQPVSPAQLAPVLNLPLEAFDASLPPVGSQDQDVVAFVASVQWLSEARPDLPRLADLLERHGLRGLSLATVHTLTPSIHVQSRFFAPSVGIDEDPVTGSVHGPLAAYLVMRGIVPVHGELAGLTCVQGKAGGRTGVVHALVQPKEDGSHAVRIGGRAVTTMRGILMP